MLSLLHGPVDVVPRDAGDAPQLAGGQWVEGLGLVAVSGALYLVTLDGSAIRVSTRKAYARPSWYSDPAAAQFGDCIVLSTGGAGVYPTHRRAHLPSTHPIDAVGWTGLAVDSQAVLADRSLCYKSGRIYVGTRTTPPNAETIETSIGDVPGAGLMLPAELGGRSRWWCVDLGTGRVYQYDAIAKAEILGKRTGFGSAVSGAGYSRKHGVFVVLRRDAGRGVDQLYVYATEPVAAAIAAPVFAGGAAPARGRAAAVSSRVLGSYGEPCAGRVVTFAATVGRFSRAGVETDADGWARTTYRAPLAATAGAVLSATLVE